MHPVSHEAPINSPTRFPNFILGGLSTKVQVTGQVTLSTYISPSSTTPPPVGLDNSSTFSWNPLLSRLSVSPCRASPTWIQALNKVGPNFATRLHGYSVSLVAV